MIFRYSSSFQMEIWEQMLLPQVPPSSLPRWPWGSHQQLAYLTPHGAQTSPRWGPACQGCSKAQRLLCMAGCKPPVEGCAGGQCTPSHCPRLWPGEGAEPWAAATAASLSVSHRQHHRAWGVRKTVPSGQGQTILCYRACLGSFSA